MRKADMKRVVALLLLLAVGATLGCRPPTAPGLKVVTTTTLMAGVVERVAEDRALVAFIVPPTQHPGNFDVRPGDIRELAEANLLLVHGWPGETFVREMVAAARNPGLRVETIAVAGNWMIPAAQAEAADRVMAVLAQVDPDHANDYLKAAEAYKGEVRNVESSLKPALEPLKGRPVIASFRQADFLQWAGLKVVGTYGDTEALTPQTVQGLVDKGRKEGARLVVDNLQSAPEAGKAVAEELGVPRLALSNFPGGFDNTETWEKAIRRNVKLITAVEK